MRVPVQWLADFVPLEMPVDELATKLTMVGLKVESVERIGEDWGDVFVAQIVGLEAHPSSKKPLHVARVSTATSEVTVVTGAQNANLGDKVAIVLVGGILPHGPDGEPIVIEAKPMAGIVSEGMLASERELGISDEHEGILILPIDAPVGAPLRSVMGGDVLDIETNPNRPDTLSIIGIAREVAAITRGHIKLPDMNDLDDLVRWLDDDSVPIRVEDSDLCPRYTALRIEGIEVKPSPFWMVSRLEAAGMRSINSIVDISNYVMVEYGQPMHAFDTAAIHGGTVVVRRARAGERIRTLDGVERELLPDMLVIADQERAIGIAGVMGGENSEITPQTTSVILESANFDGVSVRRAAQALGLRTEASSRFEKGLPPEQTVPAALRFLQLAAALNTTPLKAARISDVWIGPPPPKTVTMPVHDLRRLLGISIPASEAAGALHLLGFEVATQDGEISALVPYWRRVDIVRSADLVEEVARLVGYDSIPTTLPRRTMEPPAPIPELYWDSVVRERLIANGVNETVTHSLTSPNSMKRLLGPGHEGCNTDDPNTWCRLVANPLAVQERGAMTLPVRLMNPATQDRQVLRLTLLHTLLDVVARNLKQTDERLTFFEVDRTFFLRPADLPYERRTLGLALSGRRNPRSWQEPDPGPFSFYDMKGIVQSVLDALNLRDWNVEAARHPALHPGRSARVQVGTKEIGYFGQLHPQVATKFDIDTWPVHVAELDLDVAFGAADAVRAFSQLPRFPAAHRDVAVILQDTVPSSEVIRVVREAGGDVLESAEIFDVYRGDPLPEGTKSIAVALELRSPESTLTQEELTAVFNRIVAALQNELGAILRDQTEAREQPL